VVNFGDTGQKTKARLARGWWWVLSLGDTFSGQAFAA
jgi:hypothetical protein